MSIAQDEFFEQVRDSLNHLYDYVYLEDHPFALQYWPGGGREGPNRAQRLHRLLLETIEELHPPAASSRDASYVRYYLLLVYRYVEERPLPEIMRELGYSRRQFFREQRRAIARLAALLKEKLPEHETPPAESDDDLLAAEAGRFLAQQEAVDPIEVVQGVLEVVGHLAEQHKVTLECDLNPHLPTVYGNRTLLRQVFLKALSNLIAMPGTRRIHLHMCREENRVVVELVAETSASNSQSDGARDGQPSDLDPLCRLIGMVGGQWRGLEIKSEGCKCRFDFPIESQKVLLVVEDNEAVIQAFRRYLAAYNYQVVGATTGTEALRLARELSPTAITLDVMMPAQDGWEILQVLRNDPTTKRIPVIICSVLEDPELAHSLGAVAYLRKPVAQADLLATLSNLPSAP